MQCFYEVFPNACLLISFDATERTNGKMQFFLLGDYTLVLCPGICNSSESVYIRRVVYQAQFQGYRVAVLNHVGALKGVPITSPRIFCHGDTGDYGGLVADLTKRYPGSKIICVGFSMGGNIVTKYLGEKEKTKPDSVIGGITVCQGYDANRVANRLLQWENFRRLYLFVMTENMRMILRRWQRQLFPSEEFKRERGIVERDVWSAATLFELDDVYTRKVHGIASVEELYRWSSCVNYLDNVEVRLEDESLLLFSCFTRTPFLSGAPGVHQRPGRSHYPSGRAGRDYQGGRQ